MDRKSVCLLLLAGVAVSLSVIQEAKAAFNTKNLGCFNGKPYTKSIGSARGSINWNSMWGNFTTIVQMCADKAVQGGHDYFAVHYWGECWTADTDPAKLGSASNNCYGLAGPGMVGDGTASAVYQIIKTCSGGRKDGDTWYNHNSLLSCQSCKCNIGVTSCDKVMCDYPFPGCEKYNAPNPDRCCRTCACVSNNVTKNENDMWADRRRGICRECICRGGQVSCSDAKTCPVDCVNPEYVPGECCPKCQPKAPTTQKPETIPPTRPPPTFPAWSMKKRRFNKKFDWTALN